MSQSDLNDLLQRVEPNRREFVKRIVGAAAFATPLIASFSIEGLTVSLEASTSNQTHGGGSNQPHPGGCNPNDPNGDVRASNQPLPPGLCSIPSKNPQTDFLNNLFQRIFGD